MAINASSFCSLSCFAERAKNGQNSNHRQLWKNGNSSTPNSRRQNLLFFKKNTSLKVSLKKCVCLLSFVSVAERNYFLCNWTRLALCVCVCVTPFIYFHFSHTATAPFHGRRAVPSFVTFATTVGFPFLWWLRKEKFALFFSFFQLHGKQGVVSGTVVVGWLAK